MERAEIDRIVQRLVENPHDEESLAYAHEAGESDPKSYAMLLERVGGETGDPAYAAHWLAEAANVWSTTLGDAHRAARVLMMAIDKDPTAQVAAERLAQLYRDKGDTKALVALLDRRAKALAPLAAQNPELTGELAGMHEELGRLWSEAPLAQPKKALENYKKAIELDPTSAYAIYNARELYKQSEDWQNAIVLYAAELELEQDPARRVGLLRDEAATRKLAADLTGATRALAAAREIDATDPSLQQEYASSVLDRMQAGENVPPDERAYAAELLVTLSEAYEGEHGLAYAGAALDIEPGHDRGVQLFAHYARALGQDTEVAPRFEAYLAANPTGAMATEVRATLGTTDDAPEITSVEAEPAPAPSPEFPGEVSRAGGARAARPSDEPPPAVPTKRGIVPSSASPLVPAASSATSSPSSPGSAQATPSSARPSTRPSTPPSTIDRPLPSVGDGATSKNAPEDLGALSAAPSEEPAARRGAPMSPEKMQGVLDAAQMLAGKGKKPEAFAKFREVLESDPAHAEALAWTEDYLRAKRDYAQLRDVLLASIRAMASVPEQLETRKERLREVAGLCESNLRDVDGAAAAWRQLLALDRKDETARTALMRLLEKSQRWDDLATLLEQEATIEADVEIKVSLEKKLAKLQEDKRKDLVAAGDAWGRIAHLLGDDDQAILTASRLFERGERLDMAAAVLAEGAPAVDDPIARGQLMQRLAEIREQLGQAIPAGDSYAEAADALRNGKLWEEADRLYSGAEAWDKAAQAAHQRGLLTGDQKQQALYFARAADYLGKAGQHDEALARLEEATDLDPLNDDYASLLVARFDGAGRTDKLVEFLTKRGDRLHDRVKRVSTRREAATLCSTRLVGDPTYKELARELWLKLLEDGDDKEALERLIEDAVERADHTEAATLLRRLGQNTVDKAEKARVALREAELLAEGVGDIDTAISRYETILSDLDPTCRPALQAIADLQEARSSLGEAADALERELKLVADVQERGQIATRLARLYEKLEDPKNAIRALDLVRKADAEDYGALTRLCELCELTEQWGRVAELLVERIEIEGDEVEVVDLTKKLAVILADKLDRGDEALGALTDLADQGEPSVRQAYIELGDRLGWKGIVASKLKDWWFDARHGAERTTALRGAFERFAEVGRDADAVMVAIELVRTKGADQALARHLEELATKTGDHDALSVAHELLAREVQGEERGQELVRQAEIRVRAGMARDEAIAHGEQGLAYIAPPQAEPLLERLSVLAPKPADVIDLYERQVSRSKAPADRVRSLARAAQVASTRGQPERARSFFELALSGAPSDETCATLEAAARDGDRLAGGDRLRRALCQAFAGGGHGARDGGRTRANLLRRAALIAQRDLNDVEQAFSWLGDALVAHVDPLTLDMLESLGAGGGDPRRAEQALTHALGEVFDGPLVRQLLGRRAKIRREQLVEPVNAAADLKRLHDLAPTDQAVMDDLAGLLMELGDYKALVQLYEDQILRGKDMNARADLARQVARIWEEQLNDHREAADAWRRVLRMRAGDAEATQGLDRAKENRLAKSTEDPKARYAPPKLLSEQPVPPPTRTRPATTPPPGSSPPGPPKRPSSSRVPPPLDNIEVTQPSAATALPTAAETSVVADAAPAPVERVEREEEAAPPARAGVDDSASDAIGGSIAAVIASETPARRSVPPPLPSQALRSSEAPKPLRPSIGVRPLAPAEATATLASPSSPPPTTTPTRSRPPIDPVLESEIDASLDLLEQGAPPSAPPLARTHGSVTTESIVHTREEPYAASTQQAPSVAQTVREDASLDEIDELTATRVGDDDAIAALDEIGSDEVSLQESGESDLSAETRIDGVEIPDDEDDSDIVIADDLTDDERDEPTEVG